jgi:hypothetical protein
MKLHTSPEKSTNVFEATKRTLANVADVSVVAEAEVAKTLAPLQTELKTKFPFVYVALGTVGVTATFLGIEQILLRYALLATYPWLILGIGICLLIFTGTLYAKLR